MGTVVPIIKYDGRQTISGYNWNLYTNKTMSS